MMNIKRIIKEEMDDLDWIRDVQPIRNGRDIYNVHTIGDVFNVKIINDSCQEDWLLGGVDNAKVQVIDILDSVNIAQKDCTWRHGPAILLKFLDDYMVDQGHQGSNHHRTSKENERIDGLCDHRCWWVSPDVFDVYY